MFQDSSLSILFPRYIAALIPVVYYADTGVVPKGNRSQGKDKLSTIAMQIDTVVAFSWIWR